MKQLFISTILLFVISNLTAQQRELSVTEMDGDGSAVIQIESDNPSDADYTNMILGFNPSNGPWLRTVTNHPLSFFTNNTRRMTLTEDGSLGIGTSSPSSRLFVQNGRMGLETISGTVLLGNFLFPNETTGLDIYTGSSKEAELSFSKTSTFTSALNLSNLDGGEINFRIGTNNKLQVLSNGDVKVNNLVGSSTRNVVVTSDGRLDVDNSSPTTGVLVVTPVDFLYDGDYNQNPNLMTGSGGPIYYPIDLPEGAVITLMRIFYADANPTPSFDMMVELRRSGHSSANTAGSLGVFTSSAAPSSSISDILRADRNIAWTIGDPTLQKSHIAVDLDLLTSLSAITVEYTLP